MMKSKALWSRTPAKLHTALEGLKEKHIKKPWQIVWKIFRTGLLIGLSYVLLYPLLFMFSTAIRSVEDTYDATVKWIPKSYTLDNLKQVWEYMKFPGTFATTLIVSLGTTLLLLISCSVTAYGLSRFKFKGRGLIMGLVIFTVIVPQQFFVLSTYLNLRFFEGFGILSLFNLITGENVSINLLDRNTTFMLPAIFGIGIRSGIFIYIFKQFFKGLPKELEEAAYIDGCGLTKTFLKVIVPNAVPAFVTVFLFSFVWHWNDYQLSGILMPSHQTLSSSLSMLVSTISSNEVATGVAISSNQLMLNLKTGCLLVVFPVVIIYVVFQRFFTESIERTGLVE